MWPGAAAALADASHIAVAKGAFCRMFLPFGQYAKANAVVHVFVRCFHIDSTVLTARASSCCQSLAITGSRESERPS